MFPGKCSVALEPEVFAALKCVYSNSNDSVTRCLTLHLAPSASAMPQSPRTPPALRSQTHSHIHNTLALISLPTSPTSELAKRMPMHLCHAHTADACPLVAKSFQASSLTRGKIMFTFAATDVLTSNIELSVSSFWIYFSIAAPTRRTRIQLLPCIDRQMEEGAECRWRWQKGDYKLFARPLLKHCAVPAVEAAVCSWPTSIYLRSLA